MLQESCEAQALTILSKMLYLENARIQLNMNYGVENLNKKLYIISYKHTDCKLQIHMENIDRA